MNFDSENVLIIGGAGFIGSNIVDRLMEEGSHVCVLDDLSNGTQSNLASWEQNNKFTFIQGDMRNRNIVKESLKDIDIILFQASKVSVPFSVENPHLVMDVNVMGATVVLDESRKADVRKIVVASSSSVYGDTPVLPKVEEMLTNPNSPYAVSKLAQENLSMAFCKTYGLDITALRYFNVYGPRQRGGHYAGVIQIFISNALKNMPIPIDGDGKQTRDFTFVDDVVEANLLAINSPISCGKVYNVGGGSSISIDRLADTIISATGSISEKVYRPPREGDVRDSLAGLSRIKSELNYSPKWNIVKGISKTIECVKQGVS